MHIILIWFKKIVFKFYMKWKTFVMTHIRQRLLQAELKLMTVFFTLVLFRNDLYDEIYFSRLTFHAQLSSYY